MVLKCCNRVCQLIESITLFDTDNQRQRVLVVGRCKNPKCGTLKGEFIYWHTVKQTFIHEAIPRKDLKEIINKFKKYPNLRYYKEPKINGTFNNMHWHYQKNGNIYDFNETLLGRITSELKKYGESE